MDQVATVTVKVTKPPLLNRSVAVIGLIVVDLVSKILAWALLPTAPDVPSETSFALVLRLGDVGVASPSRSLIQPAALLGLGLALLFGRARQFRRWRMASSLLAGYGRLSRWKSLLVGPAATSRATDDRLFAWPALVLGRTHLLARRAVWSLEGRTDFNVGWGGGKQYLAHAAPVCGGRFHSLPSHWRNI